MLLLHNEVESYLRETVKLSDDFLSITYNEGVLSVGINTDKASELESLVWVKMRNGILDIGWREVNDTPECSFNLFDLANVARISSSKRLTKRERELILGKFKIVIEAIKSEISSLRVYINRWMHTHSSIQELHCNGKTVYSNGYLNVKKFTDSETHLPYYLIKYSDNQEGVDKNTKLKMEMNKKWKIFSIDIKMPDEMLEADEFDYNDTCRLLRYAGEFGVLNIITQDAVEYFKAIRNIRSEMKQLGGIYSTIISNINKYISSKL